MSQSPGVSDFWAPDDVFTLKVLATWTTAASDSGFAQQVDNSFDSLAMGFWAPADVANLPSSAALWVVSNSILAL